MNGRQQHKDDLPAETIAGAGQHLRAARESQGLDIAQIAAQLHLSVDMIEAIEEDDHEHLPGPVFVRGYLRNYARILGLDVTNIIAAYDATEPKDTGNRPLKKTPRIRTEVGSGHLVIRLITWLIVIGLIALLVLWWRGELEWSKKVEFGIPSEPTETATGSGESLTGAAQSGTFAESEPGWPAAAERDEAGLPATLVPPPEEENQSASDDPDRAIDTQPPAAESSESPAMSSPDEATREAGQETETTDGPMTESLEQAPEPVESQSTPSLPSVIDRSIPEADGVSSSRSATTPTRKVVFSFSGPCWVNIKDATRKFRIIGQMQAGDTRTLEGSPPYSIVIGDKRMVSVTVDGKPLDLDRYSRGKVARFELRPESAADE